MRNTSLSTGELLKLVVPRFALGFLALGAMLFLPAGTLAYWQAWMFLIGLFIPMIFIATYLFRHDPDLLVRRMRMREREPQQKKVIWLSWIYVLLVYTLPGLDQRFGWSQMAPAVSIAAEILVLAGYGFVFLVFRENRFASRIIEVEAGQTVIRSGPYALVRHPMYLGVTVMYIFAPLALGSYWAALPALLVLPLLVARIRNEEALLVRELPGYPAYVQETHYRLVPGLW